MPAKGWQERVQHGSPYKVKCQAMMLLSGVIPQGLRWSRPTCHAVQCGPVHGGCKCGTTESRLYVSMSSGQGQWYGLA